MEKVINVAGQQVRFKCTGGFLLLFRQLTGKDPIKAITDLDSILSKKKEEAKKKEEGELEDKVLKDFAEDLSFQDLYIFYEILWVLARSADSTVGDMVEWVNSFDEFPVADIIVECLELIEAAFKSNLTLKNAKKKLNKKRSDNS